VRIAHALVLTAMLAPPLLPAPAVAAAADPVHDCSGRLTTALRSFTEDYLHVVAGCRVKLLRTPSDGCAGKLAAEVANLARDLEKQITGCDADAVRALCPLEAKVLVPNLRDAILTRDGSLQAQLTALVDDLLVRPQAEGCPRPAAPVGNDVRECAARVTQLVEQATEELEQCAFSCERANLVAANREPCVDDLTGAPLDAGVGECVARKTAQLEEIASRCDDAAVVALGCPLGATRTSQLVDRLGERIGQIALDLNRRVFHSSCQGSLPGQPTAPTPALVTLEPSQRQRTLECGAVIDDAFLGKNHTVHLDTDLDCGPATTATDGIVVARSGVTLSGRSRTRSIRGPRRSSLRSGAGVRLLPGVSRVRIQNFKAIESFGVGIADAPEGNNKKVVVRKATVRRNVQAGVRLRSPRALVEQVTADKNGIGFDLSGDGIKLKECVAKGSPYEPKVGVRLSGADRNANGSVVNVSLCTSEGNEGVGVEIVEGAHVLRQNVVRANRGDGIVVQPGASGSRIDSSNVKLNARGIVVLGDGNRLESNTCEENFGDGFVVEGDDNVLEQNKSGKKTDRGNLEAGFRVRGAGTILYVNEAEANVGPGFVVESTTASFKGNSALQNGGAGFALPSSGNVVEACAAEANAGPEWLLDPGNVDRGGNKANGKSIALPAQGGQCEGPSACLPAT
jgi:hypothetical protein